VAAKVSAFEKLPHHGGLNKIVASARIRVRRVSIREVDVVATGIRQLANTNRGFINHPTYGHRLRETQQLPRARGWFTNPMRNGKRRILNEVGKAMHRVAKRVTE